MYKTFCIINKAINKLFFTFFGIGMFVFLLVFEDFVVIVVLLCFVFCFGIACHAQIKNVF